MTDDRTSGSPPDEYRTLLAELSGSAPEAQVDWDALHARIEAAAALPLARLRAASRTEAAWWEFAARRARAALPLAVAAGLAFVAYARMHPVVAREAADPRDAFEWAVTHGESSANITSLLVASSSDDVASSAAR